MSTQGVHTSAADTGVMMAQVWAQAQIEIAFVFEVMLQTNKNQYISYVFSLYSEWILINYTSVRTIAPGHKVGVVERMGIGGTRVL